MNTKDDEYERKRGREININRRRQREKKAAVGGGGRRKFPGTKRENIRQETGINVSFIIAESKKGFNKI